MSRKKKWDDMPCPKCKQDVGLKTEVCPHCGHELTQAERDDRTNAKTVGLILGASLLLVAILALTFCVGDEEHEENLKREPLTSQDAVSIETTAAPSDSSDEVDAAREEMLASIEPIALPPGAPEAPITGGCLTALCAVSQVEFEYRSWPGAWRGDYEHQRNTAYCLASGCNAAVLVEPVDACAWRLLVTESNTLQATSTDASNLESDCYNLTDAQKDLAATKSVAIGERIRGG